MSRNYPPEAKLADYLEDQWLDEILYRVRPGKEATVICCRGGAVAPLPLIAAKVYHDRSFRGFANDAAYQQGRVILDQRARRAFATKTRFGREVQTGLWTAAEFETLKMLHTAGADVPQPFTHSADVLLMEFIGDEDGPAPLLQRVSLERDEAEHLFRILMRNIELWLSLNRIHADLSPFNVLYDNGALKVIDFPQAVDPRFSPEAYDLLARDIERVAAYFVRQGVSIDATRLADELWFRFMRGEL